MPSLVACSEIGSAVALTKVLESKNINFFYLLASKVVKNFFSSQNFEYVILDNSNNIPDDIDLLFLGSTIGPSLERQFYVSPKHVDTYKISVIDSYWNVHQRFSNEISGARWEFSPDEIFVPNMKIAEVLQNAGFCGLINLFHSPSFNISHKPASLEDVRAIREKYGVSEDKKVYIFISEYAQKTPEEWMINIDQYDYFDIQYSIDLFFKHVEYLNNINNTHVPYIKWHPTNEDKLNLNIPSKYKENQLSSIPKEELFMLGDIFVGINSMLLLEAYNRGFKTIS